MKRTSHGMRHTGPAVALAVLLALLVGCGDEGTAVSEGVDHNDVDVAFATDMIPHHSQALAMVDLADARDLDPAIEALTDDIRGAQAPEIELMAGWLESWGEPIPGGMGEHGGDHDMDGMDMDDMPGMMSADQMSALAAASDEEFADLFLAMMIEHHQGAVEMAQVEQESGQFAPAIELAEAIESSQTEEIALMEDLLG
jgi:uncharacterized protein (DUF305 family)